MRAAVGAVAVVVPARDEEAMIGRCVACVRRAQLHLWRRTGLGSVVVVVADGCRDATAAVARSAGAHVVTCAPGGSVGAARSVGCGRSLSLLQRAGRHATWLACTDADSRVPTDWLTGQVELARRGADAVAGRVRLARDGDPELRRRWSLMYAAGVVPAATGTGLGAGPLGHVHGANLGIRGSAYARVGGFAPLTAHEDVDLVRRLLRGGARVTWTMSPGVMTSARIRARAPEGLATDLRSLAAAQGNGRPAATSSLPRS